MRLQQSITDLSRELNYLYLLATPPTDQQIEKIVNALDDLSIAALKQELDEDSGDIESAIQSLTAAAQAAEAAVMDLNKVAAAIGQAVQVVKVLDKVLQYGGKFIP